MEFVRVIGLGATLRLVDCAKAPHREKRKRDYRIKIPVRELTTEHPIVKNVGPTNAELLRRHFGGETLSFPARRMRAVARDIEIAKQFQLGIPIPILASSNAISERTVLRALARVTSGDIQRAGDSGPCTCGGSCAVCRRGTGHTRLPNHPTPPPPR